MIEVHSYRVIVVTLIYERLYLKKGDAMYALPKVKKVNVEVNVKVLMW